MAGNPVSDEAGKAGGGGLLASFFSGVAAVFNALVEDKYLGSMASQGLDELAAGLKALPDSISAERDTSSPWPSEIAAANRNQPVIDTGYSNENSHDGGYFM